MQSNSSGKFIVLDGPDGAGKSTQVSRLLAGLQEAGLDVVSLREPGGTQAGESVRDILLDKGQKKLTALAESFLFQAARAQLIEEVIKPALQRQQWVLCDRFTLSTLVYQGFAGSVDDQVVETLCRLATQGIKPDLYMVVWISPETSIARRQARESDRMEAKGDEFLINVSKGFHELASARPEEFVLIDGEGSLDEVQERIWEQVQKLMPPLGQV